MNKTESIVSRFLSNIGLFENIFGKSTDLVLLDRDREQAKRILKELYNKTDVDYIFPPELDRDSTDRVLKTLFSYYGNDGNPKPSTES